jgi:hypothetical protein
MKLFEGDHFNYENNPVLQSLNQDGMKNWSTFVKITYMDIDDLQYADNKRKIEPLPFWWREALKTFVSLYHDTHHKVKRDLDPKYFTHKMFIHYSLCDFMIAGAAEVPWFEDGKTKELYCEEKYVLKFSTISLGHLIDPQYTLLFLRPT